MTSRDRLTLVAALPPLAVIAFAAALAVGAPGVRGWFWPAPSTNVAEAAAIRDAARVRVLVAGGADLDAPLPVDPELLDDAPASMTPLEAAVRSRSADLVSVVLELGAPAPEGEVRRLHCLAARLDAVALQETLERATGIAPGSCTP